MVELLASYAGPALVASTLVLAAGAATVLATRRWDARQLTAELAIGAAALAGLQAFAPLTLPGPVPPAPLLVVGGGPAAGPNTATAPGPPSPSDPQPATEAAAAAGFRTAVAVAPSATPDGERAHAAGALLPWLFAAGAALVALHRCLGALLVWRIHRRSSPAPRSIVEAVDEMSARRVDTRVAGALRTAFCYGLVRPRMALPLGLSSAGLSEPLVAVLQHEATHVRRRDPLRRALVASAAPLLFWNPLYWWLAREATECAEFIADDVARRALGRTGYARSLLALAGPLETLRPALVPAGSPFLRRRGELRRRLTMLHRSNHRQTSRASSLERAGRTALATAALAIVTLGLGRASQEAAGDAPTLLPSSRTAAQSYDVQLEARSAEALGMMVAYLASSNSAHGEWLGVRVSSSPDAEGARHLVHLRGATTASLKELERFASEAGVMLIAVKPRAPRRTDSSPATRSAGPPANASSEPGRNPLLARELVTDPALTTELARTLASLQELLGRSERGGALGRLPQDTDTPAFDSRVSAYLRNIQIGFGAPPTDGQAEHVEGPTISLEATAMPIGDLISAVAEVSGMNFVASPDVVGSLTVRFHDVPWREALEASVRALGFRVIEEGASILRIAPETRVTPVD